MTIFKCKMRNLRLNFIYLSFFVQYISGINILCIFILRFGKNCTRENKDTTFDHKIEKFDTRENYAVYGNLRVG